MSIEGHGVNPVHPDVSKCYPIWQTYNTYTTIVLNLNFFSLNYISMNKGCLHICFRFRGLTPLLLLVTFVGLAMADGVSRCGRRRYNPSVQLCCSRHVVSNSLAGDRKCCGRRSYEKSSQICCGWRVWSKHSGGEDCCGSRPFVKNLQICCGRRVWTKPNGGEECCGKRPCVS